MKKNEEHYYGVVSKELNENFKDEALYLKAYSDSLGDENKTKAIYVKYRVRKLMEQKETKQNELRKKIDKEEKKIFIEKRKFQKELKIEKDKQYSMELLKKINELKVKQFKNIGIFIIIGGISLFGLSFVVSGKNHYDFLLITTSIIFIVLGIYIHLLTRKIKREKDIIKNRTPINILYVIALMFSLPATVALIFILPILAFFGLIAVAKFAYELIKYNYAFTKIKK